MTTIDIREDAQVITIIKFADERWTQADKLCTWNSGTQISNSTGGSVCIKDKEHAYNLIKALHKAIELGWLK